MGFCIEDGSGDGYNAKVDNSNRLYVNSESLDVEEVAAKTGESLILHGKCHLTAATSGALMYFKNTSRLYDYVITRIYVDAHQLTTGVYINQIKKPTRSNGTEISATGIMNKKYDSGLTLDADLYISDGSSDMTFTNGTNYHSFSMSSLQSQQRHMRGTNVITPGAAIGWGWTAISGSATDSDGLSNLISLSINLYRRLRE